MSRQVTVTVTLTAANDSDDERIKRVLSHRLATDAPGWSVDDVDLRRPWEALPDGAGERYALPTELRVLRDRHGYLWLELGPDLLVCLDVALARRIGEAYPLVSRAAAGDQYGPLTLLRPAREAAAP
jgi:hypothetical protein